MAMATSSTKFATLVVKRDILVKIVPIVRTLSSTMFIIVMRSLGVTQMTSAPKVVISQRKCTKAIWVPKSLITNLVRPNARWVPKHA
jgi:hypothetical protein